MILRLWLKNWISHKSSYFEFESGLNLLYGGNGVGKSAVLNAICYGLLNKIMIKGGQKKDFIRSGCEFAEIKIEFTFLGEEDRIYCLEKRIFPNKSNESKLSIIRGELRKNYPIIGSGKVNKEVRKRFGFNKNIPNNIFFFHEGEIGKYLFSPPVKRKLFLDELTSQDRVIEISNSIKELLRKKEKRNKELEKEYEIIQSRMTEERSVDIEYLQESLKTTRLDIKSLENELKRLNNILNTDNVQGLLEKRKDLVHYISSLEFDLDETKNKKDQILRQEIISQDKNFLEERLKIFEKDIDMIQNRLEKKRKQQLRFQVELESLDKRFEIIKSPEVKENKRCPTCRKPLSQTDLFELYRKVQDEKNSITEALDNISNDIRKLYSDLKFATEELKNHYESITKIKDMEKLNQTIKEIKENISNYNQELNTLNKIIDENYSDEVIQRILEIETELDNLKENEMRFRDEIKSYQRRETDFLYYKENLGETEKEFQILKKELRLLKALKNACNFVIEKHRKNLIESIERNIPREILSSSLKRFNSVTFDREDYFLSFKSEEESLNFKNLSGGEKVSAYLALRLSITTILQKCTFTLFDEPSEHLDSDSIIILRKKLDSLSKMSILPLQQVILAVNDPRFTGPLAEEYDFPWKTVYYIQKEEGISKFVKIIKKKETKSTDEILQDIAYAVIEKETFSAPVLDEIKKQFIEGNIPKMQMIIGSIPNLRFQQYLLEKGIDYIEVSSSKMHDFDLICSLDDKSFAIEMKYSSELKDESIYSKNYLLQKLVNIKLLGLDGFILAVYSTYSGIWEVIKILYEDISILESEKGLIEFKKLEEIL